MWSDVVDAFGPPSVLFGSSNPSHRKNLAYLIEAPQDPMVSVPLWNEEPLLLAVRFGTGPFRRTFTFTPEGLRRRPLCAGRATCRHRRNRRFGMPS